MPLYLPRKVAAQPQGRARVDFANPLTLGLQVAMLPSSGRFYDVTRSAAATQGSNVTIIGSPIGMGLNSVGVTTGGSVTSQYSSTSPASASYVIVGFTVNPYWHSDSGIAPEVGGYGLGLTYFALKADAFSAGKTALFQVATSGFDGSNISLLNFFSAGKSFCVGATRVTGPNGHRVFSAGMLVGTAAGGTGTIGQGVSANVFAGTSGTTSGNTILLVAYWNRALSDSEMSAVTANPWQIFAPSTFVVPVSAAASYEARITWAEAQYQASGAPVTPTDYSSPLSRGIFRGIERGVA
jgi:hypothetical protein